MPVISAGKLDPQLKALCEQNGWIAYDPKNGSYLRPSATVPGRYILSSTMMAIVIDAANDEDAIREAVKGLP